MLPHINMIEVKSESPGTTLAFGTGASYARVTLYRGAVYFRDEETRESKWSKYIHRVYTNPTPASMGRVFWAQMRLLSLDRPEVARKHAQKGPPS